MNEQVIVEDSEEKILITPDIEEIIKKLLKMPVMIIKASVKSMEKNSNYTLTDRFFLDEKGLHIELHSKDGIRKKYIIHFEQLNRILKEIK